MFTGRWAHNPGGQGYKWGGGGGCSLRGMSIFALEVKYQT